MQVVHGGNNDVLWLQRDFHIYMVNVFDTEKACQVPVSSHAQSACLGLMHNWGTSCIDLGIETKARHSEMPCATLILNWLWHVTVDNF